VRALVSALGAAVLGLELTPDDTWALGLYCALGAAAPPALAQQLPREPPREPSRTRRVVEPPAPEPAVAARPMRPLYDGQYFARDLSPSPERPPTTPAAPTAAAAAAAAATADLEGGRSEGGDLEGGRSEGGAHLEGGRAAGEIGRIRLVGGRSAGDQREISDLAEDCSLELAEEVHPNPNQP